MREGMKKMVQRISEADAARVTAEAAKAEADAKVAELETKLKAAEKKVSELTVQQTKDKAAADKAIAELNVKLVSSAKDVTRLTESLGKWKEGFDQAKTVAEGKEAERAAATSKAIVMERELTAAKAKNAEMLKVSTEILQRYEKFGFGTALIAREPFTRSMRARLQSEADELGDKIDAQRLKPAEVDKPSR
jgi:uncharacterized coiled-coil protein SlyX